MNKLFKRLLAIMLVLTMVFSLAACGSGSGSNSNKDDFSSSKDNDDDTETTGSSNNGGSNNGAGNNNGGASGGTQMEQATKLSDPNLRYVMIYNPKIYNENKRTQTSSLTTGVLGSQVDVFADRGEGLESEQKFTSISQLNWLQYFSEDVELESDRADVMGVNYNKGDKRNFYYSITCNDLPNRQQAEFTCKYAGQYCYIWTMDNSTTQSAIDDLGQEFDQNVYINVFNTFGAPRFVGETGKVNILLYNLGTSLAGYFAMPDLFTDAELPSMGLAGRTCNTGHAIINLNSVLLNGFNNVELAYSTAAHELQHLINFSSLFSTVKSTWMDTWLNEAMSGYIEAELYINSKRDGGDFEAFNGSDLIRNGQSLYNFGSVSGDIGVYGSVYYFSKYLENIAGKSIFSDMMNYWRDSYSPTLSTAEALAKGVSATTYDKINATIDYTPLNLRFDSASEEWMSKLCLDFYLSMLSNSNNIAVFQNIDRNAILYDSMDGTTIEGGGRIIVALSGDTFDIPEDSDNGLIYVGLDENFKPVTGFVYQ